jgi:His/Glu/Gln/Arg/opine family amino acid ABC transporter permease subunit
VAVTLVLAPFPWRSLARGYILLVRGTPLLVQLFLCYFGWATLVNRSLGQEVMGPMGAALMALVINTTAYHAESIRGALLSIDVGQWEAAASLGLTTGQSLRRILLPQALSRALSSLGNNSIVLIKDTSLVGAITLVELSYSARNLVFQSGQAFLPFALAGGLYLIIIAACSAGFQWLERRRPEARA